MGFLSFFKNRKKKGEPELVPYTKVRAGIALGGGGARGLGHIGVMRAFEENGISFDFVAGTSVGALVGAMYAYGLDSHEMEKIARSVKESDIRTSKLIFLSSKTAGIEKVVTDVMGEADIKDFKRKFAAVAVDIGNGEETVFYEGPAAKCVAASCCVPIVFTPVQIDGRRYVDGGLVNNVPSDVARFMGADIVVGVDINSTRGAGTDSDSMIEIAKAVLGIAMDANVVKGIVNADVMIRPDLARFKATKLKGTEEMIREGYDAAMAHMNEIKTLLNMKYRPKKEAGGRRRSRREETNGKEKDVQAE